MTVVLSIFLTVDYSVAQTAQAASQVVPVAVPMTKLSEITSGKLALPKGLDKNKLPKGLTVGKGGSIQGGGGGHFTAAMFWRWVDSIKHVMNDQSFTQLLSKEQKEELFLHMDPKVTELVFSTTQLYVEDKDGNDVPVDAVNVPDTKKIYLFRPVWDEFIRNNMEVRHLILHEFLGLVRIDDDGLRISRRYIPLVPKVVSFDMENAKCSAKGFVLVRGEKRHAIEYFYMDKDIEVAFSAPEKMGHVQNYCTDPNDRSRNCLYKDNTRNFKKISRLEKLLVAVPHGENQPSPAAFSLKIDLLLGDAFQSYGSGGASSQTFPANPDIEMITQLISQKGKSALPQVLAVDSHQVYEPDSGGEISLMTTMLNPQFAEMFLHAGISFKTASRSEQGIGTLSAQNLSNLLYDYARAKGAKDHDQVSQILERHVFQNMPKVTPIYLQVYCSVK